MAWLEEVELHNIVKESWIHYGQDNNSSSATITSGNLSRIKHRTILWVKGRKIRDGATLLKIEAEINEMEGTSNSGYISTKRKEQIIRLEEEKIKLLRQKEET